DYAGRQITELRKGTGTDCVHRGEPAISGTSFASFSLPISSQPARHMSPTATLITPRVKTRLFPSREIRTIPTLPKTRAKQLIRADAEPVSPSCCSSMRNVLGGRTQLPVRDTGKSARAKTRGPISPKRQISAPPAIMKAKEEVMIDVRLMYRESQI